MKKTLLALAITTTLMISACSQESNLIMQPQQTNVDWSAFKQGQIVELPLSFRSGDGQRLTTEMRDVRILVGVSIEEAAIQELINGPKLAGSKEVFPEQTTLQKVEVTENIANVYINNDSPTYPLDVLISRAAIANCLAAVSGIEYVNLYINDREPGYNAHPLGPSKRLVGSLQEYIDTIRREMDLFSSNSSVEESKEAILYFSDLQQKHLLPEVHKIKFVGMNYAQTLLDRLMKEPKSSVLCNNFNGVELLSPPLESIDKSGRAIVKIVLSKEPEHPELAYGSIVYTLIGFIPDIQHVMIFIGSDDAENVVDYVTLTDISPEGHMFMDSFSGFIGGSATIYLPSEDNSLINKSITLYNRHTRSPQFLLESMIEYNAALNDTIRVFPKDITHLDINNAYVSGDIAILDFKKDFADKCKNLGEQQEFLLVYSITNTMAEISGVKRVQFLIDGQPVESLVRRINIRNPILPNPGIIKSE